MPEECWKSGWTDFEQDKNVTKTRNAGSDFFIYGLWYKNYLKMRPFAQSKLFNKNYLFKCYPFFNCKIFDLHTYLL